jgi:hypothetical protein
MTCAVCREKNDPGDVAEPARSTGEILGCLHWGSGLGVNGICAKWTSTDRTALKEITHILM